MTLTSIIAFPVADDFIPPEDPVYFQFARVRFNENGRFFRFGWAHDYPRAERNFLKILSEVTGVQTTPASYTIVDLDDPRIMDFPLLYFSEPGTWGVTPAEAENLREYFLRGGFAIFDDSRGKFSGVQPRREVSGAALGHRGPAPLYRGSALVDAQFLQLSKHDCRCQSAALPGSYGRQASGSSRGDWRASVELPAARTQAERYFHFQWRSLHRQRGGENASPYPLCFQHRWRMRFFLCFRVSSKF